jgi:hypothetical protein
MKEPLGLGQSIFETIESRKDLSDCFVRGGKFHVEIWRKGKLLHVEEVKNGIATVGLHLVLDQAFRNQAGVATWYIGLISNTGYSALANGDTMSSHAGWTEHTAYDEAVRQTWVTVAAASRAITNTTVATFTINGGAATLKGIFVTSSNTKGGTSGTLWSTGLFSADRAVNTGDLVKVTYTINGPA